MWAVWNLKSLGLRPAHSCTGKILSVVYSPSIVIPSIDMFLTVYRGTKDDCTNKNTHSCSPVAPDSSGLQLQFLLCQISLWSEKKIVNINMLNHLTTAATTPSTNTKYISISIISEIKIYSGQFQRVLTELIIMTCHNDQLSQCGGIVTSWLVCLPLDWTVQVWVLARDIVLCSWVKHNSHSASLHPIKWVLANLMLGATLQWTTIRSRDE